MALPQGGVAVAAAKSLRLEGAAKLVLAAPVCATQTAEFLSEIVDEVICLSTPREVCDVGTWYKDFGQISDDEVVETIKSVRAPP